MSALLLSALAAGSSWQGALYVDDVFSTYLYTGSSSTQTINNGIDLAGKGGLVWAKSRSVVKNHQLADTVRGAFSLNSNNTTAQGAANIGFTSTGFNTPAGGDFNLSGNEMVSWTFRKAPKFFDVVTYTGDGTSNRQIPHSLGVQAGFVTVKATSATGDWNSYHRSATGDLKPNLTDAQTASRAIITAADANSFTVSGAANTNGVSYVAYLWAHDPSADGIIQCGSFTTSGGAATVNLGWEPQYLMFKRTDSAGDWFVMDTMRGWTNATAAFDATLQANTSNAEQVATYEFGEPSPTGMQMRGLTASGTFIYLAIRRPNKPPTSGAEVYNASTASGVVSAGFPVDLHIGATRTGAASNHAMHTRLTGGTRELVTSATAAEATITDIGFDSMTGLKASLPSGMVNHFFRRAPCFFDVVCWIGSSSDPYMPHSLGVIPELIISKNKGSAADWSVQARFSSSSGAEGLVLNATNAATFFTPPSGWSSSVFTASSRVAGNSYVSYLFSSLHGISKVGSYTGNGTSQTIDCGFSTGARFFLVKAASATGSWWVYDSARGIVSAADPALQLNSTAAEITSADAVDPAGVGIVVNQEATCSINATGVSYIFLAIA